MVVLYSAENFKDFVKNLVSPQFSSIHFTSSREEKLQGLKETAAFLTDLSDRQNLETLRDAERVNLVLPVREESKDKDLQAHIQNLKNSENLRLGSYILANHKETDKTFKASLIDSSERWKHIEEIGNFARGMKCFDEFSEIVMTIASELLTNAFYNGPKKNGKAVETDRTKNVAIDEKRPVKLSYGDDGEHFWIQVSDPFGTFNRKTLVAKLLESVSKDQVDVNFGTGGAGIGLYMVFMWASQLLFQFDPAQETSVMVKLKKTKRRKTFDAERTVLEVLQK